MTKQLADMDVDAEPPQEEEVEGAFSNGSTVWYGMGGIPKLYQYHWHSF